jgi:hypothetical protein
MDLLKEAERVFISKICKNTGIFPLWMGNILSIASAVMQKKIFFLYVSQELEYHLSLTTNNWAVNYDYKTRYSEMFKLIFHNCSL